MSMVDLSGEVVREFVAEALAKDPEFVAEVERLDAAGEQPAGDLEERLRRSAG